MARDTQEGSHSGVNTLVLTRPLLNSTFKKGKDGEELG